jgi:predicted O-methyltransferase YrrM
MSWQIPRESAFTAPRPDLPHPEWWTAENHMATERELAELVAAFVVAMQPERVLETGSHYGQTTELIGEALERNGHGHLVSIDIDDPLANVARNRCSRLIKAGWVEVVTADSFQFLPDFEIDLLFVDGAVDRASEYEHFVPYLADNAVALIHDMVNEGWLPQLPRIFEVCNRHVLVNGPRGLLILGGRRDHT